MQFFRSINKVEAMTFDLDDTLYNNDPIIRRAEQALQAYIAEHHRDASKLSAHDWLQLKRAAIAKDTRLASDMGQLRRVVLTAALSGTDLALRSAVDDCFNCFYNARSDFTLADNVHNTLDKLSQRIPLVGITNGNVNTQKVGLDSYFQNILHASIERPMKPAVNMFNEAALLLKVAPAHILHVGDNIIKDVLGAVNAGYQSAWFACNLPMELALEPVSVLPHVQLHTLEELTQFV